MLEKQKKEMEKFKVLKFSLTMLRCLYLLNMPFSLSVKYFSIHF